MHSVGSYDLRKIKGLHYQVAKIKGIRKFEFLAKSQFLCNINKFSLLGIMMNNVWNKKTSYLLILDQDYTNPNLDLESIIPWNPDSLFLEATVFNPRVQHTRHFLMRNAGKLYKAWIQIKFLENLWSVEQ